MSPRISPLSESELTDEGRELLALPLKGLEASKRSEFLLTLVRHPGLYRRYAPFTGKLLVAGKLPARDRELAILRGAWLCRADYEWGEHVKIAHADGLTAEDIERVTHGSSDPGWSTHERGVLRAVEELHSSATISDDTWSILAAAYDQRQLIELPMLVGAYQMIAYVQKALKTPLPSGNAGLYTRLDSAMEPVAKPPLQGPESDP